MNWRSETVVRSRVRHVTGSTRTTVAMSILEPRLARDLQHLGNRNQKK